MLTDDEVRALWVVIMSFDHRPNLGQLDLAAWSAASDLGRWTLGEARDAVVAHFTHETDYLKPGHITQRIKHKRQTLPRPGELQIEQAPPADDTRIRAAVAEVARNLGWTRTPTQHTDAELEHVCPHCGAGKNRPCGRRVTRGAHQGEIRPLAGYHDSRTQATKETRNA